MCRKVCLAKNEWNFVSWTMVCFRKKLIGVRQRFWNLVIFCPNWECSSKFVLTLLEKFQQIWSFLENEKWKNGIHDDVWLKIAHFSIQTYLKGDTEKLTIFNQLASGRPFFHFSITKKSKFAEIFPKMSKKILTSATNLG